VTGYWTAAGLPRVAAAGAAECTISGMGERWRSGKMSS